MKSWQNKKHAEVRAGFTLVEILVALAIIAILIGLLIPAVSSAMRTARIKEVEADIEKINTAIVAFKGEYGIAPPSSIVLCENAGDWSTNAETRRSQALIRRMFPDFSFGNTDFDGDGLPSGGMPGSIHYLNGAECLVFFLGGIVDRGPGSSNSGALTGFSKNPVNPFGRGGSRTGPFYDFGGSGVDLAGTTSDPTDDVPIGRLAFEGASVFPVLLDTIPGQQKPYAYFSAASGGYRTSSDASGWYNTDNFDTVLGPSLMRRAYYRSVGATVSASEPYKKGDYQIISPGFDYLHGVGGQFTPDGDLSEQDADNITNFKNGLLGG